MKRQTRIVLGVIVGNLLAIAVMALQTTLILSHASELELLGQLVLWVVTILIFWPAVQMLNLCCSWWRQRNLPEASREFTLTDSEVPRGRDGSPAGHAQTRACPAEDPA